jgi:hypothetical protein
VTRGKPSSEEDIAAYVGRFGAIAPDYEQQVRLGANAEFMDDEKRYLRIWSPACALDMDHGYQITEYIPGCQPIGDDGGGMVLFYAEGARGFGLYLVGYGDLELGDAVYLGPNLATLLFASNGLACLA